MRTFALLVVVLDLRPATPPNWPVCGSSQSTSGSIVEPLLCSTVTAQQAFCDSTRFQYCTVVLGQYWNVDTSQIWKSIDNLDNVIRQLLRAPYPLSNMVNVCNGFSSFYGCLGPDNNALCLGTLNFMSLGQSPYNAYAYQGFLADWKFKCGAGFYAQYENDALSACLQNTFVNYQSQSAASFASYATNITADPSNACTYAQNLMDSTASLYQLGPCRTVDQQTAKWYGCQSTREYTNAQFRHCQHTTTCAAPADSLIANAEV